MLTKQEHFIVPKKKTTAHKADLAELQDDIENNQDESIQFTLVTCYDLIAYFARRIIFVLARWRAFG